MINISAREIAKIVPTCPGQNCSGEFLLSNIKHGLSKEDLFLYEEICKYCLELHAEKKPMELKKKLIEETRAQKLKDLQVFPDAILKVIKISYATKLKSISKSNAEKINNAIFSKKRCQNIMCKKFIIFSNDVYGMCTSCEFKSCTKCDEEYKQGHVCLKSDLESYDYKKSLTQCPKCRIPVTKSDGCDNATCPICKTNFSFITGQIGGGGNHDKTEFKLKSYSLLAINRPELIPLLERIEMKRPVLKITEHNACQKYERIKRFSNKNKNFTKYCSIIFTHYDENTLTKELLEDIISKLN
jgi:hypothetical protein